jgi:hypothetical protein
MICRRRSVPVAALGVSAALLWVPSVQALRVRVPEDHATLLAALEDPALTHGDTVLVGPGTWTGPGNRDLSFNGKDLVVRSTHGPQQTIIDLQATPESPHRGFLFSGGMHGTETRQAVLDGFSILNGLLGNPPAPDKGRGGPRLSHDLSGAGIMCRNNAAPTIRNCIIRNCQSEYTGGGIGVEFFAEPLFENVIVQGCAASIQGGGVSVETLGSATFVNCVITGNSSHTAGGLAAHADVTLTGCVVADNQADRGGGIDTVLGGSLQVERTILWNNCAVDSGAQMYVDPAIQTPVTFSCSVIDTLGVRDLGDIVTLAPDMVFADPQFCEPAGCEAAPTTSGHYTLRPGSPCLPAANTCGQLIGPNDTTCSTPVQESTLTGVKRLFR